MKYFEIDPVPSFPRPCVRVWDAHHNGLLSGLLLALIFWYSPAGCLAQAGPGNQVSQASPPRKSSLDAMREKRARANPTYSTAIQQNRDPHEFLLEKEAALNPPGPIQHRLLAYAAKAALEAGEKEKARSYANEALAGAAEMAAFYKGLKYTAPRRFGGIPAADYYGNFVLGRLALLDGDIRSAERYLIASGKADGEGDAVLSSYGPNLSLALEVLKHGDDQSREAVLQFLDEIKVFWNSKPSYYDQWKAQIVAGEMPNFEAVGPNLYN